jgi:hypothetical protein
MSKLKISSNGKSVIVGAFLRHQEKMAILRSLKKVLKKYRFNYAKIDVSN